MNQRIAGATLVLITLLGLILRTYDLAAWSFWFDEGFSWHAARNLTTQFENTPPLYFGLLHVWMRLFGDSEVAMRSLSVLLGTASIYLTGVLGHILFDRKVGLTAAAFMAFSVFPVHYSREVRAFSLFLFLALGTYYFLVNILRRNRRGDWWGYFLFTIALCYCHYYFVFVLLAQNLCCMWNWRNDKVHVRRWLLVQVAVLAVYLPWLSIMLRESQRVMQQGFWIERPGFDLETMRSYVAFWVHPWWSWLYLAIACFGLWHLLMDATKNGDEPDANPSAGKHVPQSTLVVLLGLWLVLPIATPFLVSQVATPIYMTHYTIVAIPAFYLLISYGVWRLPAAWFRTSVVAVMVFVAGGSLVNYFQRDRLYSGWKDAYANFPVHPYREWGSFLGREKRPSDVVLLVPWGSRYAFDYYLRGSVPFEVLVGEELRSKLPASFADITKEKKRLWLLHTANASEEMAIPWIRSRYREKKIKLPQDGGNSAVSLSLFELKPLKAGQ